MWSRRICLCLIPLTFLSPLSGHADAAAFDLPGNGVEVRVTRDGRELPIAEVPNLREGDRLWVPSSRTRLFQVSIFMNQSSGGGLVEPRKKETISR